MTAALAGAAYFAIVFAVGFLLGTVRVLGLAPTLGETTAVLIEGPFILGASWLACGYTVRRFNVASRVSSRLTMGAVAFALLIGAETLLGVFGFGQSLNEVVARYGTRAGAIGLAGQIVFALFPLMRARKFD